MGREGGGAWAAGVEAAIDGADAAEAAVDAASDAEPDGPLQDAKKRAEMNQPKHSARTRRSRLMREAYNVGRCGSIRSLLPPARQPRSGLSMGRLASLLTVAIVTASSSSSSSARAQSAAATSAEGEAPEYPPPSTRWKVAAVGILAAGAFYGAGAGLSYAWPDTTGMKDLRKPVIGPWQAVWHNGCVPDQDCNQVLIVVRGVLMAMDGVAQAGSLALVLEGLFMPTQEPPAATAVPPTPRTPPSKPSPGGGDKNLFFVPLPMTVGERGIGAGVVGRF
jgi:hypothetical protein